MSKVKPQLVFFRTVFQLETRGPLKAASPARQSGPSACQSSPGPQGDPGCTCLWRRPAGGREGGGRVGRSGEDKKRWHHSLQHYFFFWKRERERNPGGRFHSPHLSLSLLSIPLPPIPSHPSCDSCLEFSCWHKWSHLGNWFIIGSNWLWLFYDRTHSGRFLLSPSPYDEVIHAQVSEFLFPSRIQLVE